MNRLIVIGNGFDLSHEFETSYAHFLNHHIELVEKGLKSALFTIKYIEERHKIDRNGEAKPMLSSKSQPDHNIVSNNSIINAYLDKDLDWVDIEYIYNQKLLSILGNEELVKNNSLTKKGRQYVESLNNDLSEISDCLEKYLSEKFTKAQISLLEEYVDVFSLPVEGGQSIKKTLVLNFNYSPTANKYVELCNKQFIHDGKHPAASFDCINIHGEIDSPTNKIIFGIGDEKDPRYNLLESLNENILMRHAKSFGYFKSYNYTKLRSFISVELFEVIIIGHSCGITDRTLFSEVLESEYCEKVHIYHHNGILDYTEKTYGLSRYYGSDKVKMRRKVATYDPLKICPQKSNSNKMTMVTHNWSQKIHQK